MYETKISDKKWIAYDIPGNIGWICNGSRKRKTQRDSRKSWPGNLSLFTTQNHRDMNFDAMWPFVVKRVKEKSINASNAKFSWGIKSGKELEEYNSKFKFVRDDSLTEGMKEFYPVYKVIGKIEFISNLSNKITVMTME